MERYLQIHQNYSSPVIVPFNSGMGGVTCSMFHHSFPSFIDTNNLSLAVFIKYGGFSMLFPGDLESAGWTQFLKDPAFVQELAGTTVIIASHHGRANGFVEEVFQYFTPQAVVISDKPIEHETQETVPDYRAVVAPTGVVVTNQSGRRHVLTTRRDGDIVFRVSPNGDFRITTAKC